MLSQTNYDSGLLVRYGIRYDINDIGTDSSSSIILDKLNPSVGLSYKVNSNDNIFFSFGTSFETPTMNELSNNPNGEGLNKNLKSSSSLNYEIGWRKALSNLTLEAIAYVISSENEILPYELEQFPGKNFYQNVGSTSRFGVELNSQLSFKGGRINLSLYIK
jgi:iron complex outermembrane receptor protein